MTLHLYIDEPIIQVTCEQNGTKIKKTNVERLLVMFMRDYSTCEIGNFANARYGRFGNGGANNKKYFNKIVSNIYLMLHLLTTLFSVVSRLRYKDSVNVKQ